MSRVVVDRRTVETSEGPVQLPILYYDVSAASALFVIDADPARDLLDPMGLEPVMVPGGRTLAGLAFYEYRDTTVGPYNEVGLAIAAEPAGQGRGVLAMSDMLRSVRRRRLGFAVLDLPVTTALTNASGREIWGYPKFVTELPISFGPGVMLAQVRDPDGGMICAFGGPLGRGMRVPVFDLVTYTQLDGRLIRTVVDVRGSFRAHRDPGLRLDIGDSNHPMTDRLRHLGLAGAAPVVVLVSHDWRSALHVGTPV